MYILNNWYGKVLVENLILSIRYIFIVSGKNCILLVDVNMYLNESCCNVNDWMYCFNIILVRLRYYSFYS